MLIDRIKLFCSAVGADIKALWAAVNGKMPRRGLYVNHGNSTERRYYLIARITNNNGSVRVKGLIGGHDINIQGGGAVDLAIHSRAGNIPIVGFVAGNMGQQDLQVYKSATNEVFIYLVSWQYGLTDLEYSETLGGTVYFSPDFMLDPPTHTLIFSAAAVAPGLGRVRAVGSVQVPPSTASEAGLNVPPGANLTTLREGDVWATAQGLYCRIAGITHKLSHDSEKTVLAARVLTSVDTRNVPSVPGELPRGIQADFKRRDAEGAPGTTTYFGSLLFRPYGTNSTDFSGGPAHQIGFLADGTLIKRHGAAAGFGVWNKIWCENSLKEATPEQPGLLSATDKEKLNGLASGGVPTWPTTGRPTAGSVRFGLNTTLGSLEYWDGTAWVQLGYRPTVFGFQGQPRTQGMGLGLFRDNAY